MFLNQILITPIPYGADSGRVVYFVELDGGSKKPEEAAAKVVELYPAALNLAIYVNATRAVTQKELETFIRTLRQSHPQTITVVRAWFTRLERWHGEMALGLIQRVSYNDWTGAGFPEVHVLLPSTPPEEDVLRLPHNQHFLQPEGKTTYPAVFTFVAKSPNGWRIILPSTQLIKQTLYDSAKDAKK